MIKIPLLIAVIGICSTLTGCGFIHGFVPGNSHALAAGAKTAEIESEGKAETYSLKSPESLLVPKNGNITISDGVKDVTISLGELSEDDFMILKKKYEKTIQSMITGETETIIQLDDDTILFPSISLDFATDIYDRELSFTDSAGKRYYWSPFMSDKNIADNSIKVISSDAIRNIENYVPLSQKKGKSFDLPFLETTKEARELLNSNTINVITKRDESGNIVYYLPDNTEIFISGAGRKRMLTEDGTVYSISDMDEAGTPVTVVPQKVLRHISDFIESYND